jgi:hypothetical protein
MGHVVAWTVKRRVLSPKYPDNLCEICGDTGAGPSPSRFTLQVTIPAILHAHLPPSKAPRMIPQNVWIP